MVLRSYVHDDISSMFANLGSSDVRMCRSEGGNDVRRVTYHEGRGSKPIRQRQQNSVTQHG
jgi:hypothetical protein